MIWQLVLRFACLWSISVAVQGPENCTDETCSADLGLLQKSYQMHVSALEDPVSGFAIGAEYGGECPAGYANVITDRDCRLAMGTAALGLHDHPNYDSKTGMAEGGTACGACHANEGTGTSCCARREAWLYGFRPQVTSTCMKPICRQTTPKQIYVCCRNSPKSEKWEEYLQRQTVPNYCKYSFYREHCLSPHPDHTAVCAVCKSCFDEGCPVWYEDQQAIANTVVADETLEAKPKGKEEGEKGRKFAKSAVSGSKNLVDYAYVFDGVCNHEELVKDGSIQKNNLEVDHCASLCRESIKCNFFAYSASFKKCFLYAQKAKGRCEEKAKEFYRTYYMPPFQIRFKHKRHGECDGVIKSHHLVTTINECSSICAIDMNCWYFSFQWTGTTKFASVTSNCLVYQNKTCTKVNNYPDFQSYEMMVKDEYTSWKKPVSDMKMASLTFQGNGFLAEADYAAVIAGFLAVLKEQNKSITADLKHLMQNFDVVVSSGSSSWLAGMLMYSERFRTVQEEMGQTPEKAWDLWNSRIMNWEYKAKSVVKLKDWYDEVKQLKEHQANLVGEVELGNWSSMQDWAKYKYWVIPTALSTGSAASPIPVNKNTGYYLHSRTPGVQWPYTKESHFSIPSKISVRLDKEQAHSISPFRFCSDDGNDDCFAVYKHHAGENQVCKSTRYANFNPNEVFSHPGRLLLDAVFHVSDAYDAGAVISKKVSGKDRALGSGGSAWLVPGKQKPFKPGHLNSVTGQGVDDVLCEGFVVADGGLIDPTGIANALATGSKSVTSFMSGQNLEKMLSGFGANPGGYFRVFEEDVNSVLRSTDEFREMYSTEAVYTKIEFSSVNLTTYENKWFGVKGGTPVKLNLIVLEGYDDYGWMFKTGMPVVDLWGQVVQALVSTVHFHGHAHTAQWVLYHFFHIGDPAYAHKKPSFPSLWSTMWKWLKPMLDVYKNAAGLGMEAGYNNIRHAAKDLLKWQQERERKEKEKDKDVVGRWDDVDENGKPIYEEVEAEKESALDKPPPVQDFDGT